MNYNLLTDSETAEYLGIGLTSLNEHVYRGRIPKIFFNSSQRPIGLFDRADALRLETYLYESILFGEAVAKDRHYQASLDAWLAKLAYFSFKVSTSNDPIYLIDRSNLNAYIFNNFDAATADLDLAIEIDPQFALGHCGRGIIYYYRDETLAAIHSFTRALDCDPHYVNGYINRAIAYLDIDGFDLALRDLERAIEICPHSANAHRQKAIVLMATDRLESALACLRLCLKYDPLDNLARSDMLSLVDRLNLGLEDRRPDPMAGPLPESRFNGLRFASVGDTIVEF